MKFPFVLRTRFDKELALQRQRTSELKNLARLANEKTKQHRDKEKRLRVELEQARSAAQPEPQPSTPEISQAEWQIRGHQDIRPLFALKLEGAGIEIGALHNPLKVPPHVTVRYVDIQTREQHIASFPHLPAKDIVETSIICDGQSLSAVPDESQDFVISNHMLEHCVNPLRALENFLRVLKPLGRLFISLPDKRFTFDFKRPVTTWEHILHDYRIHREVEEREVYEEYKNCVDENLDVAQALAGRKEIHHHAWTQCEILELFIQSRRVLGWPLEIELFAKQGCEVVLVLQKINPVHEDHAKFAQQQ